MTSGAITPRSAASRYNWLRIPALILVIGGATALPAAATSSTCGIVSVALLDSTLGIDAAYVNAVHPTSPVGALICSYYGNSGRTANEATINYVPASPKAFDNLETSLATEHKIRNIAGIKSAAYSYGVGSERYLYVLDGSSQVQMFATIRLAKLEALARALPVLP